MTIDMDRWAKRTSKMDSRWDSLMEMLGTHDQGTDGVSGQRSW